MSAIFDSNSRCPRETFRVEQNVSQVCLISRRILINSFFRLTASFFHYQRLSIFNKNILSTLRTYDVTFKIMN